MPSRRSPTQRRRLRPESLSHHATCNFLRVEEAALEVGPQHIVPMGLIEVQKWRPGLYSGVVDQQGGRSAVPFTGLGDETAHIGAQSDVAGTRHDTQAFGAQAGHSGVGRLLETPVAECDRVAVAGECIHQTSANARTSASDQGEPARHRLIPPSMMTLLPVMNAASSEASSRAVAAISATVPGDPSVAGR